MKKIKNTIYKLSVAILILGATNLAIADKFNYKPFVGLEVAKSSQKMKTVGLHDSFFSKKLFSFNLFAGTKINDIFGVEVGYDFQTTGKKCTPLIENRAGAEVNFLIETKIKARHPYVGAFAEYKVLDKTKLQVLAGASLSHIYVYVNNKMIDAAVPNHPGVSFNYIKTKLAPMVRLSVIHELTDNIAVRASFKYRQMSQIRIYDKEDYGSTLRMRSAYCLGFGISYTFI